MSIEAMKQALEALELVLETDTKPKHEISKSITSLRQAIEQAENRGHEFVCGECVKCGASIEKNEPVAWWDGKESVVFTHDEIHTPNWTDYWTKPLYTTPQPQREWVGLTDEDMRELEKQFEAERVRTSDEEYLVIYPAAYWQWQRAIEAKLKEKNT